MYVLYLQKTFDTKKYNTTNPYTSTDNEHRINCAIIYITKLIYNNEEIILQYTNIHC